MVHQHARARALCCYFLGSKKEARIFRDTGLFTAHDADILVRRRYERSLGTHKRDRGGTVMCTTTRLGLIATAMR